jgi:hypothetical protein
MCPRSVGSMHTECAVHRRAARLMASAHELSRESIMRLMAMQLARERPHLPYPDQPQPV